MRHAHLDTVCGFLIIYMIIYHIADFTGVRDTPVLKFLHSIFYFFMPWFFFKAGMFACPQRSIRDVALTGFNRLIRPFLIFSAIGHAVSSVLMFMDGDRNWVHYVLSPVKFLILEGAVNGNLPLWFLLSLFAVRISGTWCLKKRLHPCAVAATCLAAAFAMCVSGLPVPVYIPNIATGLFFFMAGRILAERQYSRPVFAVSVLVYAVVYVLSPSYVDMHTNMLSEGEYLIWAVSSVAGCVVADNVFPNKQKPYFKMPNAVGRNSMNYYVCHWIVIIILNYATAYIPAMANHGILCFALFTAVCAMILPPCSRVLDSVRAKKLVYGAGNSK